MPDRSFLHWLLFSGCAVGCIALWLLAMVSLFRGRRALLDLLEEVNSSVPYAARYELFSMNPLGPVRLWRKHKSIFPRDSGARRRVKRYLAIYFGSLVSFAVIILLVVFG